MVQHCCHWAKIANLLFLLPGDAVAVTGWLFLNMLCCGHQAHHLLPLCFDFVTIDHYVLILLPGVLLLLQFIHVVSWLHPLLLPLVTTEPQLCCHHACITLLWWLLKTGVGSAVAIAIVITTVDSSFNQSWDCHWFSGSHSCQAQIGIILHFFVKVIQWNGSDIAWLAHSDAASILAESLNLSTAAISNFAAANHSWHNNQHIACALVHAFVGVMAMMLLLGACIIVVQKMVEVAHWVIVA